MTTFFDCQTTLVVHAAVVIVPLAAVGLLAVGWNPAWRRHYYLPVTLLALAGAFAAFLAKQTGEPLQDTVRRAGVRVGDHPEQGDTAMVMAIVFGLTCLGLFIQYHRGEAIRAWLGDRLRLPVSDEMAMYLVAAPIAVLAIATMIVAGHSGASLVWKTK